MMDAVISASAAIRYLQGYVTAYQAEYERFTAAAPEGGGYPRIPVSPYQYGGELECHLARDGAVILDSSREPEDLWHVTGGPALMVDFPETRTPQWVRDTIDSHGLADQPTGIYAVVSQSGYPEDVWRGDLSTRSKVSHAQIGNVRLTVSEHKYSWRELIQSSTFGAFELACDLELPSKNSPYWTPRIIRNLGFCTADREHKRFLHYAELIRHVDQPAWEPRSIWARAHLDVRRDFAAAISSVGQAGGTLTIEKPEPPIGPPFYDRLDALRAAVHGLEQLLREAADEPEAVFHDYLLQYPILLDVYATAESKPRFHYPPGQGPTGKEYVEPDFVLTYSNRTYKLVELERPSHLLPTRDGHPRVGVTHAAYQIAEWKDFIANHYEVLRGKYPGISAGYSSMIVISRTEQRAFPDEISKHRYFDLMRQQLAVDEILTYDDLVTKAKTAISQLEALASSLVTYPPLPGRANSAPQGFTQPVSCSQDEGPSL
jgi:hypothetical protein